MLEVNQIAPAMLRIRDVMRVTGMRRTALYEACRSGAFPKPIKLGPRMSAWPAHEVETWVQAKIANRSA